LTAYQHPERVDKLGLIVGGIPSNEHGYCQVKTDFKN
jgi:hypothetical protein